MRQVIVDVKEMFKVTLQTVGHGGWMLPTDKVLELSDTVVVSSVLGMTLDFVAKLWCSASE